MTALARRSSGCCSWCLLACVKPLGLYMATLIGAPHLAATRAQRVSAHLPLVRHRSMRPKV